MHLTHRLKTRFLLSVGLPSRRRTSRIVEEAEVVHPHLSCAPRVPESAQTVVTVTTHTHTHIGKFCINVHVARSAQQVGRADTPWPV